MPIKFTTSVTFKFTAPHLKLSLMTDQVLADICVQWEPIWNYSSLLLKFQVYCSSLPPTPMWNCHGWQIKYWQIYCFQWEPNWNCSSVLLKLPASPSSLLPESPSSLVPIKFTTNVTFKFTAPHLKLSLMTDQVLADICVQWEPIWNYSSLLLKFQVYCSSLPPTPMWNCHGWQIKYWQIYCFQWEPNWNCSSVLLKLPASPSSLLPESPSSLVPIKFTTNVTFKFTAPHLKLSLMTDQVLADICVQWEPIWNYSSLLLKFQVYCSSLPPTPMWNCHGWQIKYWQIYCFQWEPNWKLLKCTAQVTSIAFKFTAIVTFKFSTHQVYYQCHLQVYWPPFETVIDDRSGIGRYMCSVRAYLKLLKFTAQVSSLLLKFTPHPHVKLSLDGRSSTGRSIVFSENPIETAQVYCSSCQHCTFKFTAIVTFKFSAHQVCYQCHLQVYCPPYETVMDDRSSIGRYMCSVRAHLKLLKFTAQIYL